MLKLLFYELRFEFYFIEDANLQQANLSWADPQNATLIATDLTGAKNLTIDQLSKTKSLYHAKLDPELMEQVKKCCPHLLEMPKRDTGQKEKTD